MPIDTSLYQILQPPRITNPLEAITQVLQGQKMASELRGLRQQEANEAAIRQVLTETEGDVEKALPRLRQISPRAALEFETEIGKARKEAALGWKAQTEAEIERTNRNLQLFRGVSEQTYGPFYAGLQKADPEVAALLPPTWDAEAVERVHGIGLSAKDALEERRRAFTLASDGKTLEALSTDFSTRDTEQEWTEGLTNWRQAGAPKELLALFGPYTPDAPERARLLGITPAKRAELAGQAAGRAQTATHQGVLEAQGAERIQIARQRLAQGTGTGQDREALMQAVLDNPGLWDQITPTERGKIAGELNTRGFTGFGKPLSDAAVKQISDSEAAIASLTDLRGVLQKNEQYIGPIAGLAAINPYSEANKARADIDRVRQRVGKTLEGGVLRKEDEEKYKRILATLTDVPSTAIYKVDQLLKDIQRDIEIYKHQQRLQGRRVPPSEAPATNTGASFGGSYQDYLRRQQGKK